MANYYVDSVGGNDSRNGTAANRAWKTLAKLNNVVFSAGDVIHLKRGSSWDVSGTMGSTGLRLVGNGASGNPITLTAYDVGAAPEIKNTNASTYTRTITLGYEWSNQGTSGHWWVIENIRVTAGKETGFLVLSNYCTIRDCEITNCGTGIMTGEDWGGSNLYTNNYIHDLIMTVNNGSSDYGAVGMWPRRGDEISYNLFYKCLAPSLAYGTDGGMVELYGECPDVHIHHNVGILCDGILEMGGYGGASDTVEGLRVHDNVTIDCGCITLHTPASSFETTLDDIVIEHNTFVETSPEDAGYEHWRFIEWSKAAGGWNPTAGMLTFRNNIVVLTRYNRAGGAHWGTPWVSNKNSFTHTHNLFMRYAKNGATLPSMDAYSPTASEIYWQDPLFESTADLNDSDYLDKHSLQLGVGSPALGAGVNLGYGADMLGVVRPVAGAVDIGAYQTDAEEPEAHEGDAALGAAGGLLAAGGKGSVGAAHSTALTRQQWAALKRSLASAQMLANSDTENVTGSRRSLSEAATEAGSGAAVGAGLKLAKAGAVEGIDAAVLSAGCKRMTAAATGDSGALSVATGRKGILTGAAEAAEAVIATLGTHRRLSDAAAGGRTQAIAGGVRAAGADAVLASASVPMAAGHKRSTGVVRVESETVEETPGLSARMTPVDIAVLASVAAYSDRTVRGDAALIAEAGSASSGLKLSLTSAVMGLDFAAVVQGARESAGAASVGAAVLTVAEAMAQGGEAVVALTLLAGVTAHGLRAVSHEAVMDALLQLVADSHRGSHTGTAFALGSSAVATGDAVRVSNPAAHSLATIETPGVKACAGAAVVVSSSQARAQGGDPSASVEARSGLSGLSGLSGGPVLDDMGLL